MKPEEVKVGDVLLEENRERVCYTVEQVLSRTTLTTELLVRYRMDGGTSVRELHNGVDVPLLVEAAQPQCGPWRREDNEQPRF